MEAEAQGEDGYFCDCCDPAKKKKRASESEDEDEVILIVLPRSQCDQMTKLCFQYLAIFSNETLPNSIQIVPK